MALAEANPYILGGISISLAVLSLNMQCCAIVQEQPELISPEYFGWFCFENSVDSDITFCSFGTS